jgi:transposase
MPCQAHRRIAASPQTSTRPARNPGCLLAGTVALEESDRGAHAAIVATLHPPAPDDAGAEDGADEAPPDAAAVNELTEAVTSDRVMVPRSLAFALPDAVGEPVVVTGSQAPALLDEAPGRTVSGKLRRDVVAVARKGEAPLSQIAKDFGISESCLHRWLKLADVDDGVRPGVTSSESAELRELKKRNRTLETENEILRRAAAYFAREISPK